MTSSATYPALPWPGLLTVLRSYSGRGQLFATLGSVGVTDDVWDASAVRRRARRALFEQLLPVLDQWPLTPNAWLDELPAQTARRRGLTTSPTGRVDWAATRQEGWPPQRFATTHKTRHADTLLTTALAWTLRRLLKVHADAISVVPGLAAPVTRQLDTARTVLNSPPISTAEAARPGRPELAALRAAGQPWSTLARTVDVLAIEDTSLDELARLLLLPDDDIRWRLFHLGCLGIILTALHEQHCTIHSRRPLGIGTGPAYTVTTQQNHRWDLWFEASGLWKYYKVPAPYITATKGLPGAGHPLGADIALIRPGYNAILVECKYSINPGYIGRDGYQQAVTYLTEVRSVLTPEASAVVVGPDGAVLEPATAMTISGPVTVAPANALAGLISLH